MDIELIRAKQRKGKDLTDEEFEALNKFWKSDYASEAYQGRATSFKIGDYPQSPIDSAEFGGPEHKVGTLHCSYCQREVGHFQATYGKVPKKPYSIEVLDPTSDPIVIHKKWIHPSKRVIACPDCVLLIQPTTALEDRDDPSSIKYVTHNVDYNVFDTEG